MELVGFPILLSSAGVVLTSWQPFFCRLSWTPEGTHIIVTNAMQEKTRSPTTLNISRTGWSTSNAALFVGHTAAICAVRVNPKMFYTPVAVKTTKRKQQREEEEDDVAGGGAGQANGLHYDDEPASIVAALSQDRKLSVWNSTMNRPLVVVTKALKRGVADAAWTPDGYTLLACSYDGSVCVCR
jgi:protein HIRA/HIR1